MDKRASLTPQARAVMINKATEPPYSGEYNRLAQQGSYLCRNCGLALFRAKAQFQAGCGWPSFDEDIVQAVGRRPDEDGVRTEIVCQRCGAHLGHVFEGEHLTPRNLRHCVNSLALDFVADEKVCDTEEAIVAGGCFWGVDYFLHQLPGVLKLEVGYCGGHVHNPRYEDVCRGDSGHYEAVRVIYDLGRTDYSAMIKRFFEIHDPTQRSGQGPDIGQQYHSAIFYYNAEQLGLAEKLTGRLRQRGYDVVTRLLPVQTFWRAEEYHQDYYLKNEKVPYCHQPVARFGD